MVPIRNGFLENCLMSMFVPPTLPPGAVMHHFSKVPNRTTTIALPPSLKPPNTNNAASQSPPPAVVFTPSSGPTFKNYGTDVSGAGAFPWPAGSNHVSVPVQEAGSDPVTRPAPQYVIKGPGVPPRQ